MLDFLNNLLASFQEPGQPWFSAEIRQENPVRVSDDQLAYSLLSQTICPISSLPITNRPEWKDIAVDENYTVSFFLIGSRILCAIPRGIPTPDAITGLLKAHNEVLEQTGLARKKRVEIRDFSEVRARPSKEARMILANQLLKDLAEGHLIGFYVAHAPFYVKWMFQVGSLLHKPNVPFLMVKSFGEAVKNAVEELKRHGLQPGAKFRTPMKDLREVGIVSIGSASFRRDRREDSARGAAGKALATTGRLYTDANIRKYVDDLIRYIGAINWDQPGLFPNGIEEEHPFRPVFDALALIKTDLDDLHEQREKSRASVQESELRYRSILESIEDGYFEVDLSGNLTFFNVALCNILGYSKDELQGMNNRAYMDEENSRRVYKAFHQVYESAVPMKGFEYEIVRKDGGRKHLEVTVSPVRDAEKQVIGFRGIARDITRRKTVELELERYRQHLEEMVNARTQELTRINKELEQEIRDRRKAEEELRAASAAKSQFLAKVSHEIRTPLNGIIGMAELCLESSPSEEQIGLLQTLNREATSLFGIINSVLDFSKIEAGKLELEEIPFDLRNTFEDIAQAFAYSASQKGLDLKAYLSPDVPTQLLGDPGKLRQILRNLLENAVKFTERGRIFLKGELAQDFPEKVRIRFFVRDTGIGIAKEKQAAVFESFTQADNSTTRKYGGTGLGITIAKQIAEMMGGKMVLESEEGKGSAFQFTAVFRKNRNPVSRVAGNPVDLRGVKILVLIDEGPGSRSGMADSLRSWGCIPSEVMDPEEALGMLTHSMSPGGPFDLIIIALTLSLESGFELSVRIRNSKGLEGLPILLITPLGKSGDGKRCREIGINGYLTKPVWKEDLRRAIEAILDASRKAEGSKATELITRHTIAEQERRKLRILLAEDYPTNQQVVLKHLEKGGYRVDVAETGRMAVTAFKERHYDLILMDLQMPDMDGYEATKAIRDLEKDPSGQWRMHEGAKAVRVPIIAMTAHAVKGYYEQCIQAGMDDYLPKPFRGEELLSKVESWLSARKEVDSGRKQAGTAVGLSESKKTPPPGEAPPMDFEKAVKEFEGDREGVLEITGGFIRNAHNQVKTMREALEKENGETVRKEAHSIKGGASNLTALRLSGIAKELEEFGKDGLLDRHAGETLDLLQQELKRLEDYIGRKRGEDPHS